MRGQGRVGQGCGRVGGVIPDRLLCAFLKAAEPGVTFRHHESCSAQGWRPRPRGRETVPRGESATGPPSGRPVGDKMLGTGSSLTPAHPQIWEKNRKLKSFNLSALDKHGPVYEDGKVPGQCLGQVARKGSCHCPGPFLISPPCTQTALAACVGHIRRPTCCMWLRRSDPRPSPSFRPKLWTSVPVTMKRPGRRSLSRPSRCLWPWPIHVLPLSHCTCQNWGRVVGNTSF